MPNRSQNASAQPRRPDRPVYPISADASLERLRAEARALQAELAAAQAQLENAQAQQEKIEAEALASSKELYLLKMQLSQKVKRRQRKVESTGPGAKAGDQPPVPAPNSREANETENVAAASGPARMLLGDMKHMEAVHLKQVLTILNLDTKGTKEVLRQRILDHFDHDPAARQYCESFSAKFDRMLRESGLLGAGGAAKEDTENIPGPSNIQS